MALPARTSAPAYTVKASADCYAVMRGEAPLKTPAGAALIVPTETLAEAIVREARAQGGKIDLSCMPLTQLAMTAVDVVAKQRDKIIDQVAAYAANELLCHRADPGGALAVEQQRIWQPVLAWCAGRFKAPLEAGVGIMPIAQPQESLAALRRAVAAYDDFHLAGLAPATGIGGSLVLALALAERHLTAEQVFRAAELDGTHQMKKWGEDPVTRARHESIRRDLEVCERWFAALAKGLVSRSA